MSAISNQINSQNHLVENTEEKSLINQLPAELLGGIFKWLTVSEMRAAASVSRWWRTWAEDAILKAPLSKPWGIFTKIILDAKQTHGVFPACAEDNIRVKEFYSVHPVPDYEISAVKVIHNLTIRKNFESKIELLQRRNAHSAYAPKWSKEPNSDWRKKMDGMLTNLAKPYIHPDYPNVKFLPIWTVAPKESIEKICQVGHSNLQHNNFFSFDGIKGSLGAKYAQLSDSAAKTVLLLSWAAIFSAYPVTFEDMRQLARGWYQNYDAYFVPLSPINPQDLETHSLPCRPLQQPTYFLVALDDVGRLLPRYVIELQKSPNK